MRLSELLEVVGSTMAFTTDPEIRVKAYGETLSIRDVRVEVGKGAFVLIANADGEGLPGDPS